MGISILELGCHFSRPEKWLWRWALLNWIGNSKQYASDWDQGLHPIGNWSPVTEESHARCPGRSQAQIMSHFLTCLITEPCSEIKAIHGHLMAILPNPSMKTQSDFNVNSAAVWPWVTPFIFANLGPLAAISVQRVAGKIKWNYVHAIPNWVSTKCWRGSTPCLSSSLYPSASWFFA